MHSASGALVLCWQVARLLIFNRSAQGSGGALLALCRFFACRLGALWPCLQRMRLVLRSTSKTWLSRSRERPPHGSVCKPRLSWYGGHSTCSCPCAKGRKVTWTGCVIELVPEGQVSNAARVLAPSPCLVVFGRPLQQLRSHRCRIKTSSGAGSRRQSHVRRTVAWRFAESRPLPLTKRLVSGRWSAIYLRLIPR